MTPKLDLTGQRKIAKTILVTGGCGFIFSNFIRYMLSKYPDYKIINLDNLSYSGLLSNTKDFMHHPNYKFVKGDIRRPETYEHIFRSEKIDCIINGAAQTHVDRSILDSGEFIDTNVFGTQKLLEKALEFEIPLFIQVGTDEEYGSIEGGSFTEEAKLNPSNPYSASKLSLIHI